MNVKQLISKLVCLPDEMEVILQKDAEGNEFSPLNNVDTESVYIPYSDCSGEAYSVHSSAEDECMSEKEWEEVLENTKVLILYPMR